MLQRLQLGVQAHQACQLTMGLYQRVLSCCCLTGDYAALPSCWSSKLQEQQDRQGHCAGRGQAGGASRRDPAHAHHCCAPLRGYLGECLCICPQALPGGALPLPSAIMPTCPTECPPLMLWPLPAKMMRSMVVLLCEQAVLAWQLLTQPLTACSQWLLPAPAEFTSQSSQCS